MRQILPFASVLLLAAGLRRQSKTERFLPTRVEIANGQLLVNGSPFHMKGVCWNAVGYGGAFPWNLDNRRFAPGDAAIMAEAGINTVRAYDPIRDTQVLDDFWKHGIYVVNSAYSWGGASVENAVEVVNAVKDHPALLMWTVGNEWNYNNLYFNMDLAASRQRVADVVAAVKANDPSHPVSTVYGELPDDETLRVLNQVDIWGINAYRGMSFHGLMDQFKARSDKLLYFGEYGADAWDTIKNQTDFETQAECAKQLTTEIVEHSSVTGGNCAGGFIFEFADEWWKAKKGDMWSHDAGGICPGGGPPPDKCFNEEWWGLVDVDRKERRPAFKAFADTPVPGA